MENQARDLNEIGRYAYKMLQDMNIIPKKEKSELTLKEREKIVDKLKEKLIFACRNWPSQKYEFMSYIYVCVSLYLDNIDLNKYLSIKLKNNE